jgi:hypothetical protein
LFQNQFRQGIQPLLTVNITGYVAQEAIMAKLVLVSIILIQTSQGKLMELHIQLSQQVGK